jgi:SAM-dependent methyltransferase
MSGEDRTTPYQCSHLHASCGEAYDERYDQGALELYWRVFERPVLERLFSRARANGAAEYLDFACGTGRVLQVAAQFFEHCVGVDVSESMLERARLKVHTATLLQIENLDDFAPRGQFDVMTLFRFVLNAESAVTADVLRLLRSAVSEKGLLILNNHRNSLSARGLACRTRNWTRQQPRRTMSAVRLQEMLHRAGFEITERLGIQHLPSWRNHLLLPARATIWCERLLTSAGLDSAAENQIYVCRPA